MRTTLALDDDVMLAARDLATHQGRTIGEVVSDLLRKALKPPENALQFRNGIMLLPNREGAPPVTLELVNRLRDDEP